MNTVLNEKNKKNIILFKDKKHCCGCTACYSVCPRGAISMVEDDEGFLYPVINSEVCVKCQKCLKVCPLKNK